MGAGLSGALNLLVGLSQARGKLFIIEEPEDDLHPGALKKLLDAIVDASKHNQFLISTHSGIVLTRLGAAPGTIVVQVTSDGKLPPTSKFEVKDTPEDRIEILHDLGYSLADMALGEGWLIFEESTAERLVYQWLVPWFAPGLLRLRHVSARGNERVPALLTDFKEMFLFAHLEPLYRHRAWVILDGDERSLKIIGKLQSDFAGWPTGRFRHWDKEAIEDYYPRPFAQKYLDEVIAIENKHQRQKAKQELFQEVVAWIEDDTERAREEFEKSAEGMITVLREIEVDLTSYGE
jgi:predicted ATP-dependent endonuclease of OLD family